eukprot:3079391-Pleurochrysis_carterae.AAC.1
MEEKIADEDVPLGSNTASSSFGVARTGGDFEKAGASSTCTFDGHLHLAHESLARRLVVLLEAFHVLAIEVGINQRCLRKSFDDVDAFQPAVEERNEGGKDADGGCLRSSRE